ncbi:hypothetical protein [Planctobacterium marinum]|uniref:Uncharacterized protein n=1 Tax=Planctobacterium marinum TaxID=1631968 RepID=A0AA48KN48_9ALTE|nr:hypothetical protein MACH26_06520 [Planctobacterium marinum]
MAYPSTYEYYVSFISRLATMAISMLALILLIGVFIELPAFYRPLINGQATHPLTALLVIFASVQLFRISSNKATALHSINCCSFSIVMCFLVLLDNWFNLLFVEGLTDHIGAFEYEKSLGLETRVGNNTAVMFTFLALSHLCFLTERRKLCLSFAIAALIVITISLLGYFVDHSNLYGGTSLMTASIGLQLCLFTILMGLTQLSDSKHFHRLSKKSVFWLLCLATIIPFALILTAYSGAKARPFSFLLMGSPWLIAFTGSLYLYVLDKVEVVRSYESN